MMKCGWQKKVPVLRLLVSGKKLLHQSGLSPCGNYSTFSIVRRQALSHQPASCPRSFWVKLLPRCGSPEQKREAVHRERSRLLTHFTKPRPPLRRPLLADQP